MRLKTLATIVIASLSLCAHAQEASTVPAELKQLDYLVGHWEGSMAISFGDTKSTFKAVVDFSKIMGGRYIQGMHKYSAAGMPDMTGMALFSYQSATKKWMGWWFDSEEAGTVEMVGGFEGDSLVITSKPMEMSSMGVASMRSTWTKVSDTRLKLKVEMKQDQAWSTFIQADYSKK